MASAFSYKVQAQQETGSLQWASPASCLLPRAAVKLIFKTNRMVPSGQPDRSAARSFRLASGSVRDPSQQIRGPRMRGLSQADSGRPTPTCWPQPPPPAAPGRRAAPSSDCGPPISEHPITARPLSGARIKSLSCREEPQTGQSQPVRHGVRHQAARSPPREPGAACSGHQPLSAAGSGCGPRPGLRVQGTVRHAHEGSGLQQGRQGLTTRLLVVL